MTVSVKKPVRKRGSVTLSDMARETGFSKETISHVLNGRGPYKHSDRTREAVTAAALRMGYRPHSGARAIRQGRFNTVGLLFRQGEFWVDLPPTLIAGIGETLSARGLKLVLLWMGDDKLSPDGALTRLFGEHSVDGLLISCWGSDAELQRRRADALALPVVWINAEAADDSVRPDDFGAGRIAAEHLLRLGHRRVAFVQFGRSGHFSERDRLEGFRQTVAAAGLEPLIVQAPAAPERRMECAAAVLALKDRPTGVATYSAVSALTLSHCAASRFGLVVPRDLSLVTIDEAVNTVHGFALSTVMYPCREMGAAAAEILLARMGGSGGHEASRTIPFNSVRGDSCAPPPACLRRPATPSR